MVWLVLLVTWMPAQEKPLASSEALRELSALEDEFAARWKVFMDEYRQAQTPQQRLDALRKDPTGDFTGKFLALAQKYADDPALLNIAIAVCRLDRGGKPDSPRTRVLALVRQRHLKSDQLVPLLRFLAYDQDDEEFVKAVLEANKNATVQASAYMALAQMKRNRLRTIETLKQDADYRELLSKSRGEAVVKKLLQTDVASLTREIEEIYQKVLKDYARVPLDLQRGASLAGPVAERNLFEVRDLAVGKTAPDFAALTFDGKTAKLSETRGQIVVLQFWATWSASCRDAIPAMRKLVEKYTGKPVHILGLATDRDHETVKKFVLRTAMPWTHWWSPPVADRWNVSTLPANFVLDARGVIRFKNVSIRELDAVIDRLLQEKSKD
jgi:peroxiredoxin